MSQDLLANETHVTDYKGTLQMGSQLPKQGDDGQDLESGRMFYNNVDHILYIYDGSSWFGSATVVD